MVGVRAQHPLEVHVRGGLVLLRATPVGACEPGQTEAQCADLESVGVDRFVAWEVLPFSLCTGRLGLRSQDMIVLPFKHGLLAKVRDPAVLASRSDWLRDFLSFAVEGACGDLYVLMCSGAMADCIAENRWGKLVTAAEVCEAPPVPTTFQHRSV